jgi:hypothetical protein
MKTSWSGQRQLSWPADRIIDADHWSEIMDGLETVPELPADGGGAKSPTLSSAMRQALST